MNENKLKEISTAALAYYGDCVIELLVREHLLECGYSSSAKLNARALDFVRAPKQAEAMKNILPVLSEEEDAIFKRGRNMSGGNVPKSATMSEYRIATGMEVLFGWLKLSGDEARIKELFRIGYGLTENN